MQGVLKSFKPKLNPNGTHSERNNIFYFIVEIDISGVKTIGEAGSKSTAGSKSWIIGKEHEFEKMENSYAEGGYYFKGLKVLELVPSSSKSVASPSFDIEKESYVISRFAHTYALERLLSLTQEERKKLETDHGTGLIYNMAAHIAKSVYEKAMQIQAMHEARNNKTA